MYRHIRQDKNEVFYIGIGTVNLKGFELKSKFPRAFKKRSRNKLWENITKKTGYYVEILFISRCKEEIKKKEIEFIKLYKRKNDGGTLANLTNGGDGLDGFKHTEISKIKIGKSSALRIRNKGYKLNLSEQGQINRINAQKNKIVSDETKRKFSNNLKGNNRGCGHIVTEEQRQKTIDRLSKKVFQYDKNWVLIREFKNIKEAELNKFDSRGIKRFIEGKTESYKDCFWKIN